MTLKRMGRMKRGELVPTTSPINYQYLGRHTKSARILASLPSQGSTSSFPGFGSSSDTQRRFAPTNEGGVRFEGQGIKPKGRAELNTGARELEGIREGAMNEVKELRRELEREKRRAKNEAGHLKIRIDEMREEMNEEVNKCREALNRQRRAEEQADAFKKRIAEMRSEEESMRKEMEKLKSRTKEEVDGLMKCIAEMQSKLEEDQHGSGKTTAAYSFLPFSPDPIRGCPL